MKRFALVFALMFSISGLAFAQKSPASSPTKKNAPTQKIDIEDENVTGNLEKPTEQPIIGTTCTKKRSSLIKIRENFTREIVSSAHDL